MREIAWLAAGGFLGMVLTAVWAVYAMVPLVDERDELLAAIDEWNEADRRLRRARIGERIHYHRLDRAESALRKLAQEAS